MMSLKPELYGVLSADETREMLTTEFFKYNREVLPVDPVENSAGWPVGTTTDAEISENLDFFMVMMEVDHTVFVDRDTAFEVFREIRDEERKRKAYGISLF